MRFKADYGWWLTASTADMLARSLRDIAIPITVFYLSDDIRLSGIVESLGQLAFLLTMLIGGKLADSRNRRALMVSRGVSGSLLWITVALLVAFGMLPIWVLVAAVVVNSALDGLLGFGDNAALRSILPDNEAFARAQGVNQARNSIISVGGGPLGGLLYASAIWLPYFVSSVLMALLAIGAKRIKANLDPGSEPEDDGSAGSDEAATVRTVRQGLAYVVRHSTLRSIALCVMFLNAGLRIIQNALFAVSREIDSHPCPGASR